MRTINEIIAAVRDERAEITLEEALAMWEWCCETEPDMSALTPGIEWVPRTAPGVRWYTCVNRCGLWPHYQGEEK